MKLTDALAQFNRKERYWLIRNALGSKAETLDIDFRSRLGSLINVAIPDNAWWAMDYHLDWLVGALHLIDERVDETQVQRNDHQLVKGNQEDLDLVIAFGETLILIEAKGAESWNNAQINSKINRLNDLREYQEQNGSFVPNMFFVLTSPSESTRLERNLEKDWPSWMKNNKADEPKPYWMSMDMTLGGAPVFDGKVEFKKVVRCIDDDGTVGREGGFWKISPSNVSLGRGRIKSA
ncbi:MAG: hypothetical protein JJ959_06910 [Nisaea sp.]|uniref:hypothetical protein n=1 Tax=Nisaea sp. TaxID=2024842 RepID=UPI001B1638EB|nr:hypothetical protein [Nisaea sp.]MBO6560249.1 hypothetical protein [Nisaea sp.]